MKKLLLVVLSLTLILINYIVNANEYQKVYITNAEELIQLSEVLNEHGGQSLGSNAHYILQNDIDLSVVFTAVVKRNGKELKKEFNITVLQLDQDILDIQEAINYYIPDYTIGIFEPTWVTSSALWDITLPTTYKDVSITWSSNKTEILSDTGKYTAPTENTEVTFTVTFTKNGKFVQVEHIIFV